MISVTTFIPLESVREIEELRKRRFSKRPLRSNGRTFDTHLGRREKIIAEDPTVAVSIFVNHLRVYYRDLPPAHHGNYVCDFTCNESSVAINPRDAIQAAELFQENLRVK